MIKLIKFHSKQILKAPFFWICFLLFIACFSVFGFLCNQTYQAINYVVQFDNFYTYAEIFLIPLVFCVAVWSCLQKSTVEQMCLFSNAQINLSKFLSTILVSCLYLFIPIGFVIINSSLEKTGFLYSVEALIYCTARWAGIIFVPQSLAILLSTVFKSYSVFVGCFPITVIFSYFNKHFFSWFVPSDSRLPALFNLQKSNITGFDIDYTGARLDSFFVSKLLCEIVGVLFALAIIWLLCAKRKWIPTILSIFLFFIGGASVYHWNELYPQRYDYSDKLTFGYTEEPIQRIMSYSGEIILSERVDVKCDITVENRDEQTLTFRLDECFDIDYIVCEDNLLQCHRHGDLVEVDVSSIQTTAFVLSMAYSGRVYYESENNVINIFSTKRSAALPAPFAFLPTIDGDYERKEYSLTINSSNTLISNLNVEKIDENMYSVQGDSITCSLFSGYFTEYEQDGIIFYRALYNQSTDYDTVYEWSKELRYYDLFAQSLTEGQHKTPSKVFMIYALYGAAGFPIVIDDYVLLNYGYPV